MCWVCFEHLLCGCAPPAGVLAGPFVHFGFPYLFIFAFQKNKKLEIDGVISLNDDHQAISIILIVLTVYIKRSMDEVYHF